MQRIGLRKYLWRVFSPLVLQTVIAFLVELIVIGIYSIRRFPEYNGTITTSEQMLELTIPIRVPSSDHQRVIHSVILLFQLSKLLDRFFQCHRWEDCH